MLLYKKLLLMTFGTTLVYLQDREYKTTSRWGVEKIAAIVAVQSFWPVWINMSRFLSKIALSRSPLDPEMSYHLSHQLLAHLVS